MSFFGLLGIILGAFCCGHLIKSCSKNNEESNDLILIGDQSLTHRSVEVDEVPPKYEEIDRQN